MAKTVAIRLCWGLIVLVLPSVAAATEYAYEQVGAGGENIEMDYTARACDVVQGCFAEGGLPCSATPGERCDIAIVPAGRCSRGDVATNCIWPDSAGSCVSNAAVPCIPDPPNHNAMMNQFPSAQCADLATDLCDATGNDPSCACVGRPASDPAYEGTVCGPADPQARCSDGDPDRDIGGQASGLCVTINIGGGIQTIVNCGSTSVLNGVIAGPKFSFENAPDNTTPQRLAGAGLVDPAQGGPILDLRVTGVFDIEDPGDGNHFYDAVRLMRSLASSFYSDSTFTAGAVTGGFDANIDTWYCDAPEGWEVNRPVSGRCLANPGIFCIADGDCPGPDVCDPSTFVYCHQPGGTTPSGTETLLDGLGAMWERDLSAAEIAANPCDCPPSCNSASDFHTGEFEALTAAQGVDPRGAVQLAFDHFTGPQAGKGQVNFVQPIVAQTMIGLALDKRCYIDGNPDVVNSVCNPGTFLCGDGVTPCFPGVSECVDKIGSCDDVTGRSCNPADGGALECGGAVLCLPCGGTPDTAHADCAVVPSGACFFDPVQGSTPARPPGYDPRGFDTLDLAGRVKVVADTPYSIRTPILGLGTNYGARSEFSDGDAKNTVDDQILGGTGPTVAGIGTGGSLGAGATLKIDPLGPPLAGALMWIAEVTPAAGVCSIAGTPCRNDLECPGGESCSLHTLQDFAPGPDGIMGCIGDNDPAAGVVVPCDDVLGTAVPGSTGVDDVGLSLDFACPAGSTSPDCSVFEPATHIQNAVVGRFKVSDPYAPAPVWHTVNATTIRDLSLLGLEFNLDVMTKSWTTWCPLQGVCLAAASPCLRSEDCPDGDVCTSYQRNCTRSAYCSLRGGDTDGDGFCDLDDPCDSFVNSKPFNDSNGDGIPNECQCGDTGGGPPGEGVLQSADAFGIAGCVVNPGACALDISLSDADNNGMFQSADAFAVATQVVTGSATAFSLTCARRPEGTPP